MISIFSIAIDPGATPSRMDQKKVDKLQRTPLMKSNVVSQISSAIGKHTSGLSSDVLSKFASRARNRPKEDLISQLEEDHERLQKQISQLQTEYDRIQSLCLFCAGKMHSYLGFIDVNQDDASVDNNIVKSCLKGLEKVKDILAKTSDIKPSTESHERQFAAIDKSLSEAFDDKTASKRGRENDALLLSHNKYHLQDTEPRETGTSDVIRESDSKEDPTSGIPPEGNVPTDSSKDSNATGNPGDLDYIGYDTSDIHGGMSSNNSESNLSESRSSSSSATPEPWGSLKPTESLGDFEKELLLIKDRYGANSDSKQGSITDSKEMNIQARDTNTATKDGDQLNDPLDPLSSLEQHFDNM